MTNRVVITGMGACTGACPDVKTLWKDVAHSPAPKTPTKSSPVTVTDNADNALYSSPVTVTGNNHRSPFDEALGLCQKATIEAFENARLLDENFRISQIIRRLIFTVSASKPLLGPAGSVCPPEIIGQEICKQFQLEGERQNIVAACATGAYSVALGASWIEQGLCDMVVAGSVEPTAHELIRAGFQSMGVLTDDQAMRPFDRQRSGFVLGAGAGVVILESERHARERGVPIHARLSGWGLGSDPHSAVAFNSNGEHIAQVIRKAMKKAGLTPRAIQHVNAHGTATRLNDWIETQALIKAFGAHAEGLLISGTKSSTGHLLGAAGSVELILTVMALKHQYVPPTAHLDDPDPECPLNYTPRFGRAASLQNALSLSFGFGGPIGALIVSRN